MPRGEAANQRLREAQREKILEAASKVFARKGLAATMDDIAAEAGVSHGLAYRYFASKDTIFIALMERLFHANPLTIESLMEQPGTPGERLTTLVSKLIESRQHPEFYQILDRMSSDEAVPDNLRELVGQRSQALQDALRRLIVEGQASGEVAADDPDQLVRAILACADGLVRWAVYYPGRYHEHFPDVGIFLRMFKP